MNPIEFEISQALYAFTVLVFSAVGESVGFCGGLDGLFVGGCVVEALSDGLGVMASVGPGVGLVSWLAGGGLAGTLVEVLTGFTKQTLV